MFLQARHKSHTDLCVSLDSLNVSLFVSSTLHSPEVLGTNKGE